MPVGRNQEFKANKYFNNGRKLIYFNNYITNLKITKLLLLSNRAWRDWLKIYSPLGKPQINGLFFSGPATKALPPPPIELSGNKKNFRIFFRALKTVFFLKNTIFAASLTCLKIYTWTGNLSPVTADPMAVSVLVNPPTRRLCPPS